jgi:hypothetical protein
MRAHLDITSHDIKRFFTDERHPIVPWKHDRYKGYFVDVPFEIALTYEWSTSFRDIREFLSPQNVRLHNETAIDPNPSLAERIHLMSGAWKCLGPLSKIPLNIEEKTIFIDIMFNDQTNVGEIANELKVAEGHYRNALLHIILGTRTVLNRAWCLYEIAVRREARRRSQLLLRNEKIEEDRCSTRIDALSLGFFHTFKITFLRSGYGLVVPAEWLLRSVLGLKRSRVGLMHAMPATVLRIATGADFNFFHSMAATKEEDKRGIGEKILQVFGSPFTFDNAIGSATVRSSCSRLELSLLLWLEAVLWFVSAPVHAFIGPLSLSLVAALALCHVLSLPCGARRFLIHAQHPLITDLGTSRFGASCYYRWAQIYPFFGSPLLLLFFCLIGGPVLGAWSVSVFVEAKCRRCCASRADSARSGRIVDDAGATAAVDAR